MQPKFILCHLLILYTGLKSSLATTCSDRCSGLSNRFKPNKGSSYVYNYQSSTSVQLAGVSKQNPSVSLQAKVTISAIDQCEYLLQVSDAKFNGPPASQVGFDIAQELTKNSLPFSYDNGAISHICPQAKENNDALNVKRGILSTFQLSNNFDAEDDYELDISGNCPVRNHVRQEGDAKIITETKNLLACFNHKYNYSSIRFIPYSVTSKIQNIPTINATQVCTYKVQQNVLREASCSEVHRLLPFSSHTGGGVVSKVESKLTFVQEGKAAAVVAPGPHEPLLFNDQPFIYRESKEAADRARNLIKQLQEISAKEIRPESPGLFQELVYNLKATSLVDLRTLGQEAKAAASGATPQAKQIFVDAVAQTATEAAVHFVAEMLTPKSHPNVPPLSYMEKKLALLNLALTAHPTEAGIAAVTAVLNDLPDNGLFSATALVNNYIRLHGSKGRENKEVTQFVHNYIALLSKLTPNKNQAQNEKLIEALRAFGNLAQISDGINERLAYLDKDAPIDVKLAAIQSLRRAPCNPTSQNKLLSIFSDEKISVELRLNAFLVLVRQCTSKELISQIANITNDKVKMNQVGSFVQSYFSSIRNSKDPNVDRNAFSRAFLTRKFRSGSGRYSTFTQQSSFSHPRNLGYHADVATIFVPEDAYPRQASVNLTLDIFGDQVNILELGLRNEHLHDVVDNLFGPEGFFSESVLAGDKEVRNKVNKHPKLADIQAAYDAKHKHSSGLDLSAYVRLFGDEIAYNGGYNLDIIDLYKKASYAPSILNFLAKDKKAQFLAHRLPFDTVITVPTISGLPLRVGSNGSLAINVEVGNKVDLKNVEDGNVDVRLKWKPSASYHGQCHIAVYVGSVKNGVQVVRNSHSATSVEFVFNVKNREQLTAKIDLPKQKQEIFSVQSHIYSIINNVPIEERGVEANRGEGQFCAPTLLSRFTGLQVCSKISYPNASYVMESPYFPFTGPAQASLSVEKVDPEMSSYELTATWKPNPNGRDVILKFDTPKSKINRQISLNINYVRQKSINVEYQSSARKIMAKGVLEAAGADNTGATVSVGIDGRVYEVKGKIARSSKPDNYRKYTFDGDVKSAELAKTGHLEGILEFQPGRKFNLDGKITNLYDKPVSYKARVEKSTGKYSVEYDYRGLSGYRRIAGDVNAKSLYDLDCKFDIEEQYNLPQPHKLQYTHKHNVNLGSKSSQISSNSKLTSNLYPSANFAYDLTYDRKPEKIELKATTLEGNQAGLTLEALAHTKPNDFDVTGMIKYPKAQIHKTAAVVYRQNPAKGYEASITYKDVAQNKESKASITAKGKTMPQSLMKFVGDFNAIVQLAPNQEFKLDGSVKNGAAPDEYIAELNANWPPNRKAHLKSTIKGNEKNLQRHDILTIPDYDPIELFETIKLDNNHLVYKYNLKKKSNSVFILDADVNVNDAANKVVKTRVQLPTQQFDYGFDGTAKIPSNYIVDGTVNKNNKPYFKLNVITPQLSGPKKAKFSIVYGLDQPAPKSLNVEYETELQGQITNYHSLVDVKFPPQADYKIDFLSKRGEGRTTNITIFKQDKPYIKVNVDRLQRRGQKGHLDLHVNTFAPLPVRDLVGRASFETSAQKHKGKLFLADQSQKQQISVDFDATKIDNGKQSGYDKVLNVKFNEIEVEAKNRYASAPGNSDVDVSGALSVNANKKMDKYKWSMKTSPGKFGFNVETPVPNFNKVLLDYNSKQEGSKKTCTYDIAVGKDTANIESKYDYSEKNILLDLTVKSTLESLKNIKYSVKSDQRNGLDAAFNLDINNVHKLGSFYTRSKEANGDEKHGIGCNAKLGTAYDWETSSNNVWNAGKYVTKNSVRTSPSNKYRVDVDLNTKSMEAKVDLENIPGIKSPVTGKATRIGEDEYEISIQDASGPKKGLVGFKFTGPSQKLRLETTAFKSSIESEYTANKFVVGTNIVPDPSTPTKAFGLRYSSETLNQFVRNSILEVQYPERKLSISSKRTVQPNAKVEEVLELNPNAAIRQPVKIQYSVIRSPNAKVNAEFHLTDQTIPDGLHVVSEYLRTGNMGDENADYSLSTQVTLKYTSDPQRHLTFKKENQRQVISQRSKVSSSVHVQHQASNLNHKLFNTYLLEPCSANVADCEYAFSLGAQYSSPSKAVEEVSIDIKRSHQKLEAMFVSGANKYKLSRKHVKGQCAYSIAKNDKDLYDINTELVGHGQPSASISIVDKAHNVVLLRASAALKSGDLATVEVHHDESGKLVKDIDASIKLEASDRLKFRYYRRPGLTDAVNKFIAQLPKATSALNLPAVQSHVTIGKEISEKLRPLFDSLNKEDDAIASELKFTSGKLANVIREQSENAGEAISFAIDAISGYSAGAANALSSVTKSYRNAANGLVSNLPDFNKNVIVPLRDSFDAAGRQSNEVFKKGSSVINDLYTGSKINELVNYLIKLYRDAGKGTPTQKVLNIYSNLRKSQAATDGLSSLDKIQQRQLSNLASLWAELRPMVVTQEQYKDMTRFFDDIASKIQWAFTYKDPSLPEGAKQSEGYRFFATPELPFDKFLFNASTDPITKAVTVNANIPLFRHYNSLLDLLNALSSDRITADIRGLHEQAEEYIESIFGIKSGVPDDEDRALVVGQQYFVTFDGQVRTISTDCSYVLAKDYIDSLFSVHVEFAKSGNNIIVQYGEQKIALTLDGKVSINGKNAELPYLINIDHHTKLSVIKEDNYITSVHVFNGLDIACNSYDHVCIVSLDSRFRGRTNGLLGRNDGETYTDLLLPDESVAPDFNAYLKAWALDSKCAGSQNKPQTVKLDDNHPSAALCQELFGGRARYQSVEQKDFLELCKISSMQFIDQLKDNARSNQSVCLSSSAIISMLPASKEIPSQCIQCEVPHGNLALHETSHVQGNKVDVILLIDNRDCLAEIKSKMGPFARKIEENLKNSQNDVKFGLAAFNNEAGSEHSMFYTSSGEISFAANGVQVAVNRLSFEDRLLSNFDKPLDVLEHVTQNYIFRAGSRKVIVLFTCRNCATLELDYYSLQNHLLGHNFVLHVVTPLDITLGGPSGDPIIGFDATSFINANGAHNPAQRPNLVEPHDSCTVLAQETNGTVFSIARKSDVKFVFDVLANEVSRSAGGNVCNICECISNDLHPKTQCWPCKIPIPTYITSDKTGFLKNPFHTLQKLGTQ